MGVSHFPWISVFSPYSRTFSVHFSYFKFFRVSQHFSSPTLCVSHFPWFSVLFIYLFWPHFRSCCVYSSFSTFLVYLAIFHVLQCVFLVSMIFSFFTILQFLQCAFPISTFFSVSSRNPCHIVFVSHFPRFQFFHHYLGPTVWISHFPRFLLFLIIFQFLQCAFLIFHVFQCFFFAIFQVLHCAFLIFHVFQFLRHITDHTVFVSHFSSFSVFSPYSRYCSMNFSISTFYSFSRHFPVLHCALHI